MAKVYERKDGSMLLVPTEKAGVYKTHTPARIVEEIYKKAFPQSSISAWWKNPEQKLGMAGNVLVVVSAQVKDTPDGGVYSLDKVRNITPKEDFTEPSGAINASIGAIRRKLIVMTHRDLFPDDDKYVIIEEELKKGEYVESLFNDSEEEELFEGGTPNTEEAVETTVSIDTAVAPDEIVSPIVCETIEEPEPDMEEIQQALAVEEETVSDSSSFTGATKLSDIGFSDKAIASLGVETLGEASKMTREAVSAAKGFGLSKVNALETALSSAGLKFADENVVAPEVEESIVSSVIDSKEPISFEMEEELAELMTEEDFENFVISIGVSAGIRMSDIKDNLPALNWYANKCKSPMHNKAAKYFLTNRE